MGLDFKHRDFQQILSNYPIPGQIPCIVVVVSKVPGESQSCVAEVHLQVHKITWTPHHYYSKYEIYGKDIKSHGYTSEQTQCTAVMLH